MALIKCEDCEKEVSERAVQCIHCGAPITGASEYKKSGAHLTTTQETSKRIKTHQAFSAAVICIGVVMIIGADDGEPGQGYGALLTLAGFVYYLITRIRAWWHHG